MVLLALAGIAVARPASAYHRDDERIVDETAHTLRAREFRVGLWEMEVAPLAFVTVGTDNVPLAAGLAMTAPAANGHLKVRLVHTAPVTVSVVGAAYYNELRLRETTGTLWLVPLSAYVSSDIGHHFSLHLGATYTRGDLEGRVQPHVYRTRATVAGNAVQLHAGAEIRVSRVVAFVLQGHAQPYASPGVLQSRTTGDVDATVDFTGTVKPVDRTAVAATGSVVFSGKHLNARVGAGYGVVFVPSMGLMLPVTTVLPEIDFYARF